MGWAAGSSIMHAVVKAAQRFIRDPKDRRKFYVAILPEFNDHDWDTQHECQGLDPIFDLILHEQGYLQSEEDE